MKTKFSENLIKFRKARNWPQAEVALRCNVSQQCVSEWENDKTEPTLSYLIKLAKIFEVSLDELAGTKN